nr:MAG TPA: hypothetical protein [Caudoviricetes sp.]
MSRVRIPLSLFFSALKPLILLGFFASVGTYVLFTLVYTF